MNTICARSDTICPRPLYARRWGPAAAHPLRLRRPARLAFNSCGLHEY